MPGRRTVLAGAAGLAAGRGAAPAAAWEPERPVQLLVSFAPGGGAYLAARAIAGAASPLFRRRSPWSTAPAPAAPSPRSKSRAWCRKG